ncbi:hypothetical protein [Granulicella sibirica]|uniref:hypothetical protein n=1 Tax=Granulicella sibirica TaxID=2479048 RepID=UPI001008FCC9|nr:hypothetical protein [Granulicella sibirica]
MVLYDSREQMTCIATVGTNNCATKGSPLLTLTLDEPITLRVMNGQWLTRYILHWGSEGSSSALFPIVAGGPVQMLALESSAAETAKPSLTPRATKWTANAILGSVLDPGASATPELDIERQFQELTAHRDQLQSEVEAFNDIYGKVVTQTGVPCNAIVTRSGFQLANCLTAAYGAMGSPASRQEFLTINQEWRHHFEDVQSFAREFNANRIGARTIDLESAIGLYIEEAEAFKANVRACMDAYSLAMDIRSNGQNSVAALAARMQIRASLAAAAGTSASVPSSLLERELLADAEIKALNQTGSLPYKHLTGLNNFCINNPLPSTYFASDLGQLREKERFLSSLVKSINDIQALDILKLNAMYESTNISPIDTFYNTNSGGKQASISYSIGIVRQFTPYVMVGAVLADSGQRTSGSSTNEEIVASGAFMVAPGASSPAPRKHILSSQFLRIF